MLVAARCHLLGWDLSRETLAKIESQIRWVADCEMLCLALALKTSVTSLLPPNSQKEEAIKKFFRTA